MFKCGIINPSKLTLNGMRRVLKDVRDVKHILFNIANLFVIIEENFMWINNVHDTTCIMALC